GRVAAGSRQPPAVRAEHASVMTFLPGRQDLHLPAGFDVPKADGPVRRRRDALAGGVERGLVNRPTALAKRDELLAAGRVPEPYRSVIAARGQARAVRADRDPAHRP